MRHRKPFEDTGGRPGFAVVFDACVTPIAILDEQLQVEYANAAFCALFEFGFREDAGLSVAEHVPEFRVDYALGQHLEAAVSRNVPLVDFPLTLANHSPLGRQIRIHARRIGDGSWSKPRLLLEALNVEQAGSPESAIGRPSVARRRGSVRKSLATHSPGDGDRECGAAGVVDRSNPGRQVLDIAMREQQRFVRELQDNMLQSLAGIELLIDESRQEHEAGTLDGRLLALLSRSAREAGRRTRDLADDVVRPRPQESFVSDVVDLVRRLGNFYGVTVEVDVNSDRRPGDAWVEANLIRIARSATLRTIRDGYPDPVRVSISDNGICLRIEIGNPAKHGEHRGGTDERADVGIMACHAEFCGAMLSLERRRGAGSAVVVSVPLRDADAA